MPEILNDFSNITSSVGLGVEFAKFKLKDGVAEEEMLEAAKNMKKEFTLKQIGFLGHGILKGDDGFYVDLTFAISKEKAEEICGKWMENKFALKYLEFIDPDSVEMSFWGKIQ